MGPAPAFEAPLDRMPGFWPFGGREKATLLPPRVGRSSRPQAMTNVGAYCTGGFLTPSAAPVRNTDAATCRKLELDGGQRAAVPPAAGTIRLMLSDLAMTLCQLLLFINHYRRLFDAHCPHGSAVATGAGASHSGIVVSVPGSLCAYPCAAPTGSRIAFLIAHMGSTFRAALRLPLGELWVPLVSATILAHLMALLLMPRAAYLAFGRRACMVLVGLLPKAVSLATLFAFPAERPSSYFDTYLPIEGAITVWQQLVYNYPFWPGMAVLAAHCLLSTAICITVAPRLRAMGEPPLFNATWVMMNTYFCAALAVLVALQQRPASAPDVRGRAAALVSAVAAQLRRRCTGMVCPPALPGSCEYGDWGAKENGSGLAAAAVAGPEDIRLQAAVCRLLESTRSDSNFSTCSVSYTLDSASGGSSLAPSEPASAAGSGTHSSAAGVAQAACQAAAKAAPTPGPLKAWKQLQLQQPSSPTRQMDVRAGPFATAVTLADGMATELPGSVRRHIEVSPGKDAASPPAPNEVPAAAPSPACVTFLSAPGRSTMVAAAPPAGAFSLKQPKGLSKWTIVEDQEFQAPPAVGVGPGLTMGAIGNVSAHSRRSRRYQSRAPSQRVFMKIPWAEPDQLPGNFLERLNLALSEGLDCMAVGVSVRQGCIELVFDVVPQAAFDSASNFNSGQRRRRHTQQNQDRLLGNLSPRAEAAPPATASQRRLLMPSFQQQLQPGHLDLLGQVEGCDSEAAADPHGALEAAVLSGLLSDVDPASWIDALHLQPPPDAEVLTQACGRVWISHWDAALRQWVPEKAGGLRPSQLPRITQLRPSCILVRQASLLPVQVQVQGLLDDGSSGSERLVGHAPSPLALVWVTVSNAGSATPPAFSARCRGRYLPVVARRVRGCASEGGDPAAGSAAAAATLGSPDELGSATFELELPEGLPRNGLVVLECKVGKLLSNWRPLIVTEDPRLAEELASLTTSQPAPAPAGSPERNLDPTTAMLSKVGATAAAAVSMNSCSNGDSDTTCWDDLHSDLGLWLDYLEVMGLSSADSSRSSSASGVSGPAVPAVALGADQGAGCRCAASSGSSASEAVLEVAEPQLMAAAAAAAPPTAVGSLDLGPGLAALYSTEGYRAHMAGIAATLLQFAVERGWCHAAAMLVGQMLAVGIPWPDVLRRCSSDGLTLLHRAVRSGGGDMVELLVRLGDQHGTPFDCEDMTLFEIDDKHHAHGGAGGSCGGETPLRPSPAPPDEGRLADRILSEYQAACELWGSAVDMRRADRAREHLAREQVYAADTAPASVETPSVAGASTSVTGSSVTVAPRFVSDADCASAARNDASSVACGGGTLAVLATAAAAAAKAVRGVVKLFTSPFVGDRRSEAAYVQAVGAESVLWCCSYLVYQLCMVFAVAGRMVKELRPHNMASMMLFCTPHLASAALLCTNFGAWLRLREPLWAAVTLTRSLAKLLPALGLMSYAASADIYLTDGLDALLEGLVPAFFERIRAPFVLPLRVVEGIATALLYRSRGVEPRLVPAGVSPSVYAMAWTLACGVITCVLDARSRRRLAPVLVAAAARPTQPHGPRRPAGGATEAAGAKAHGHLKGKVVH